MADIDEVVAELQREKRKNAELLERITALEAQIQLERVKGSHVPLMNNNGQAGGFHNTAEEQNIRKHKKQKIELNHAKFGSIEGEDNNRLDVNDIRHDVVAMPSEDFNMGNGLVSWMSMDDAKFQPLDKPKDAESIIDCDETDESEDEDEPCSDEDAENSMSLRDSCNEGDQGAIDEKLDMNSSRRAGDNQVDIDVPSVSQNVEQDWDRAKKNARFRNLSLQKKPPKVAFCPKEAKGILASKALAMKNAQSHTMRKIIVFASLGIRHGCDDMYELDFNHFSILRKGEPFTSPDNPGEHVLYDNPGVRRTVFYRNHHNPALCPVQILEEEHAMRPSDVGCPSCLFLCIKYGGKTRNIPQNEYVRQRMGRNKLKSFGPQICQIARLVNIRTGSFFFKTLGITLLFMAGFPDDIVEKETKYRNLDLLQKYYRRDEDAAGEELFYTNASLYDLVEPALEKPILKTTTKSKGKKQTISTSHTNSQRPPHSTMAPSTNSPTQFGLLGYTAAQTPQEAPFQTMPSQTHINSPTISTAITNCKLVSPGPNISYNHHPVYPVIPTHPANAIMPFMYWPTPQNIYSNFPYPSSYGYQPLGTVNNGGHYFSIPPQPYYSQGLGTCSTVLLPQSVDSGKDQVAIRESESSSGSTTLK